MKALSHAESGTRVTPLLLAFVSGYVDAAVFVAMGGLFVAHVTGNFVLLGATITGALPGSGGGTAALQMLSFPIFFAGAFLAARIARARPNGRSTQALLSLAAALIALDAATGLLVQGFEPHQAMGFAFAMGVLNAAHRLDPLLGPPFTVMTGNVTALAVRAAGAGPDQPAGVTAGMMLLVTSFAAGCAAGAFAQSAIGFAAMLLPAAMLAARLSWK